MKIVGPWEEYTNFDLPVPDYVRWGIEDPEIGVRAIAYTACLEYPYGSANWSAHYYCSRYGRDYEINRHRSLYCQTLNDAKKYLVLL
jgi:hypothetical protein